MLGPPVPPGRVTSDNRRVAAVRPRLPSARPGWGLRLEAPQLVGAGLGREVQELAKESGET